MIKSFEVKFKYKILAFFTLPSSLIEIVKELANPPSVDFHQLFIQVLLICLISFYLIS